MTDPRMPMSGGVRTDSPEARPEPCLFCDRTRHRILCESANWYVRHDAYAANPGHVELVTKRHVVSLFDLDGAESAELYGVLLYARRLLVAELGAEPDGWTIGVNDGRAAGRSIDHLHVHLIPRWHGDVPDPRGGIRQCVPNCNPDAWAAATPDALAVDHPKETP
ncbi:HIT family protein [Actinomadura viridis]|uniref:HIT family protein n=1 Tax=Actinomadura viridis TaxID=58110 RepID=UPI0036BD42F1